MNVTIVPSFVPNPSGRGTLGLLWECLFTYFLCLWTVVHPDIIGRSKDMMFWEFKTNSKFGWCCLIFFFPEYAVFVLVCEHLLVREVLRRANEYSRRDREPATTGLPGDEIPVDLVPLATASESHPATVHTQSCPVTQKIVGTGPNWGLAHGYFVAMGGIKFKYDDNEAVFPTLVEIIKLAEGNMMLPTASFLNTKIQALQKSDKLAKALVCLQVSWLIVQAIARRIEKLPVTLLELNTIAQVWVTLVIYGLWWFKPQGIEEVVEIDFSHCQKCQERLRENGITRSKILFDSTPISDYQPPTGVASFVTPIAIIPIVIAVYVAIDALGWTAHFPTHAEMIVWNVSICILAAGMGLGTILALGALASFKLSGAQLAFVCAVLLGGLARIVLTIEALLSIRSLPLGAYSRDVPGRARFGQPGPARTEFGPKLCRNGM